MCVNMKSLLDYFTLKFVYKVIDKKYLEGSNIVTSIPENEFDLFLINLPTVDIFILQVFLNDLLDYKIYKAESKENEHRPNEEELQINTRRHKRYILQNNDKDNVYDPNPFLTCRSLKRFTCEIEGGLLTLPLPDEFMLNTVGFNIPEDLSACPSNRLLFSPNVQENQVCSTPLPGSTPRSSIAQFFLDNEANNIQESNSANQQAGPSENVINNIDFELSVEELALELSIRPHLPKNKFTAKSQKRVILPIPLVRQEDSNVNDYKFNGGFRSELIHGIINRKEKQRNNENMRPGEISEMPSSNIIEEVRGTPQTGPTSMNEIVSRTANETHEGISENAAQISDINTDCNPMNRPYETLNVSPTLYPNITPQNQQDIENYNFSPIHLVNLNTFEKNWSEILRKNHVSYSDQLGLNNPRRKRKRKLQIVPETSSNNAVQPEHSANAINGNVNEQFPLNENQMQNILSDVINVMPNLPTIEPNNLLVEQALNEARNIVPEQFMIEPNNLYVEQALNEARNIVPEQFMIEPNNLYVEQALNEARNIVPEQVMISDTNQQSDDFKIKFGIWKKYILDRHKNENCDNFLTYGVNLHDEQGIGEQLCEIFKILTLNKSVSANELFPRDLSKSVFLKRLTILKELSSVKFIELNISEGKIDLAGFNN